MKRIICALAIAIGVVPIAAAPSFAGPTMPTYAYLAGNYVGATEMILAASLSSPDHRCVLNRTVTFEEFAGDTWVTLGSDTTTHSEVAAIKATVQTENFRVRAPAKKLSDGTKCSLLVVLPASPSPWARAGKATRSTANRTPLGDLLLLVNYQPAFAERYIAYGYLGVPQKCRGNRVVKLYRDDYWGYVLTSRDTTNKSGVFGLGGELGTGDPGTIKISLVKKKLSDGTVCAGETYAVGAV